eukprot:CAMPEP_0117059368 /NCGR_PEP_ID=MMETSP0472-20121206/41233_1 /TAXON_ID=693140 ORGANISM="Tiarina fusus, Strain LIS" /NCGR_SAMPLE_ID=MMETSP0472 /ASSEMBLY_ACC=CAM_ASM_000603 /LENGTH=559 /DNA_ID=CAMNT_0004777037 /DNA_START=88 /DNA_END=1767 /DNA_ORIENTATION=-
MKGNQGLEALAALCGGQSDAPTESTRDDVAMSSSSHSEGTSGSRTTHSGNVRQLDHQQEAALQQALAQNPLISNQQNPLNNVSPQQWQQAIAAAAALQGGAMNPTLTAQSILLSAGLSPHALGGDNAFMQQLALHQYVQAAKASAQQAAQLSASAKGVGGLDQNQQAVIMALAAGKAQQLHQSHGGNHDLSQQLQQVIPVGSATPTQQQPAATTATAPHVTAAPAPTPAQSSSTAGTTMRPPPPPSQGVLPSTLSNAGIGNQAQVPAHATIAPMPGGKILPSADISPVSSGSGGGVMVMDDKKQMKRAANRRSAQLSRKRKKQFIEELKEENDDLRRKELILKSIPDLIVVFDSSGKLGFVSESVSRFIDLTPEELEGTSFWNRLCEDSVRLLKAAFMDSLAARKPDSDTAPLGSGVWELRLVDKDSSYLVVTLNGVVHFSGEAPECVCCIRPRDMQPIQKLPKERAKVSKVAARAVSSSDGSRTSDDSGSDELQIRAKPSQSVMSNDTSTDVSVATKRAEIKPAVRDGVDVRASNDGQVVRISDGDSGCEISESGSDD